MSTFPKHKTVVVGSGHNGLTATSILAQHSWEVEVFEKSYTFGGSAARRPPPRWGAAPGLVPLRRPRGSLSAGRTSAGPRGGTCPGHRAGAVQAQPARAHRLSRRTCASRSSILRTGRRLRGCGYRREASRAPPARARGSSRPPAAAPAVVPSARSRGGA
ncbi:NAD(P)-binding protein [Corynebacterium lehmanniae]|nr:NAD(P)-binding protein [Corynebacterium lehmanniae]